MKTLDNDYGLKIALADEYKKTMEFIKMYEDLVESFQYAVGDLLDYATNNRIDLPNRNRVYRNMEKAKQLIEYRISRTSQIVPSYSPTDFQQRKTTPDDETEPKLLLVGLLCKGSNAKMTNRGTIF